MKLHIVRPNCGKRAFSTHMRQLSPVVTEIGYECRNPHCFARFVFQGEVARWLQLPISLDPRLNVPLSPAIQIRQQRDALSLLRIAELGDIGEMFPKPKGQLDIFHDGASPHGP